MVIMSSCTLTRSLEWIFVFPVWIFPGWCVIRIVVWLFNIGIYSMFFCAADFIFCFGFKVLVYIILKNPFKNCRTCHQLWSSGSSSVSAVITRHSHPREALPRSINSRECPITHQELLPFYKVCLVGVKIGTIFPFNVTRLVLGEDRFFLLFVQL